MEYHAEKYYSSYIEDLLLLFDVTSRFASILIEDYIVFYGILPIAK